jgi:hypothetical protein
MIDYIDIENYSAIRGELSFRDIDVKSIINIETKKSILEFGLEQFKKK